MQLDYPVDDMATEHACLRSEFERNSDDKFVLSIESDLFEALKKVLQSDTNPVGEFGAKGL